MRDVCVDLPPVVYRGYRRNGEEFQGFADEIFRVWQVRHPESRIIPRNMNENVEFMVKRAGWVDDLLTTADMGNGM